ncbi:Cell cycle control protein 50C [Babesia sp. Xinjiang]|uniref:Cell cycle control protein 50C n=1 Tax=Babesia sp. Xinjiang TaxID=462227 RepID=UPI000A24847C|nr:Cell cycle control protein 50C [Babesia sp. Xinjiang]ORM39665.1 Cell cycle control protein 50C [Babesia sp. Xinjiang]
MGALTPKGVTGFLASTGIALLVLGVALIIGCREHPHCEVPYDVVSGQSGIIEFTADACPQLRAPLKGNYGLYYKLNGYYQNHKDYRRSVDYNQLYGLVVTREADLSSCGSYLTDYHGKIYHPCGAVTRTVFTDRFTLYRDADLKEEIQLDESREAICNRSGVHWLFKNPKPQHQLQSHNKVNFWLKNPVYRRALNMDKTGVGEGVENSHFINWVEPASTSTFKKLYGIFDGGEGHFPLYVNIEVTHPIESVVRKSVVIEKASTLTSVGYTMGVCYVMLSLVILLMATMGAIHTFIKYIYKPLPMPSVTIKMCAYIAPVADDPVTKLQNLLQNTLYSFADITITLAPEKARQFREECAKIGVNIQESAGGNDPAGAETVEPNPSDQSKPAVPGSLEDRVTRLGMLNDHIQATVDDLPDLRVTKEQIVKEIELLHEECERAATELRTLYGEFDAAFQILRTQRNKDIT